MNDKDRELIDAMFAKDGIRHKKGKKQVRPKKDLKETDPEPRPTDDDVAPPSEGAIGFAKRLGVDIEVPKQVKSKDNKELNDTRGSNGPRRSQDRDHGEGTHKRENRNSTRGNHRVNHRTNHRGNTSVHHEGLRHETSREVRENHQGNDKKESRAPQPPRQLSREDDDSDKPTNASIANNPLAMHLGLVNDDVEKKRLKMKQKLLEKKRLKQEQEEDERTQKYLDSLDMSGSWADFE